MVKKINQGGVYVSEKKNVIATVEGSQTDSFMLGARGMDTSVGDVTTANLLTMPKDPNQFQSVRNYKVSPWGSSNDLPNKLLRIVNDNNLAPGLIEFKEDMIWGKGVRFEDVTGGIVGDSCLYDWLESWDYENYLLSQISDFETLYNTFGQFIKTKKGDSIAMITHVPAHECRCEVMKANVVENILVADWINKANDAIAYPTYNSMIEIAKHKDITMYHNYRPTTGYKYYGLPKYMGATRYWIPLVDKIPKYHLSMIENALNALYHIQIPIGHLESLKSTKNWTQIQLDEWLDTTLDNIDEMLTGVSNAGKTLYTYTFVDPNTRTETSWKITPIDNKMKSLSEGYLKLFNDGNQAITSAFQVQPSLACVQLGDKMSSGSEILNAYNLHMQTRTQIPRKLILKPLQEALRINFPKLKIIPKFEDILLVKQEESKTGLQKEQSHAISN